MVNRDYTKEVGIESGDRTVPRPIAAIIVALMAVGGWYGLAALRAMPRGDSPVEKVSTTTPAQKQSVAVRN